MTKEEEKARSDRSYKLLLLFAMVSMTMMFGGLTSAFVVSKSRADWLKDFEMPSAFFLSTLVIIGCSVTFHLAKKSIQKDNKNATTSFLLGTLALGILFVILQFVGFRQVVEAGYFFIPDYEPSGSRTYRVYIGPFLSRDLALQELSNAQQYIKEAYIVNMKQLP
jgi:cytochrome c oxidase subunit 3